MSSVKTLWVINPKAGGAFGRDLEQEIRTALADTDVGQPETMAFTQTLDRRKLVAEIEPFLPGLERVIAVGGDGTVSRVIAGSLPFEHLKVGILPLGTGNRMAHNLGIPLDFYEALRTILTGESCPLDVGKVNGEECFILMAGAGADAVIMKHANQLAMSKRVIGIGAYFLPTLEQVLACPIVRFTLTADGRTTTHSGLAVLVANVGKLLGRYSFTPDARVNDGVFDVAVLAIRNKADYIKAFYQFLTQTPGHLTDDTGILYFQAKHIRIESDPAVDVQVDGDAIGETPLEIEMDRQVQLIVPERAKVCEP